MSATDKVESVTASSSSVELDPLLKDLTEKKLSFKKNVVSLAAELKDVRRRLALQEQSFTKETHTRKVAFDCLVVKNAKSMEEEIGQLQICLQDKDEKLKTSVSTSQEVQILDFLSILL
ncbi:hypothetical protein GW17_00048842 [Ensete ventricosum]|nr:hypothetical protein GW17_00048842 [Ensete ventricosum]